MSKTIWTFEGIKMHQPPICQFPLSLTKLSHIATVPILAFRFHKCVSHVGGGVQSVTWPLVHHLSRLSLTFIVLRLCLSLYKGYINHDPCHPYYNKALYCSSSATHLCSAHKGVSFKMYATSKLVHLELKARFFEVAIQMAC